MRDARAAGYATAPVPSGAVVIGGLHVVRAGRSVAAACRRARGLLRYPIYCPTRLPATWQPAGSCPARSAGDRRRGCRVFKLVGYFDAPPEYVGSEPNEGHVNFWAMPTAERLIYGGGCPDASPTRRLRFRGHPGAFSRCPEGSSLDSGHLVLEWSEGAISYGVSAHGFTDVNRRLVVYLATHLKRLA